MLAPTTYTPLPHARTPPPHARPNYAPTRPIIAHLRPMHAPTSAPCTPHARTIYAQTPPQSRTPPPQPRNTLAPCSHTPAPIVAQVRPNIFPQSAPSSPKDDKFTPTLPPSCPNIFLVQELLRKYARKRISPRCMLKVDLHKAFDSVSWSFLEWMLSSLGFPSKFVGWIMECITTTSYSVMVNGNIYGHFKGGRGIRQGDPLSPYLFVLALEYLSRELKCVSQLADFKFHPSCRELKITHLAFADDLMLFCRGDYTSVKILIECLDSFANKSGLTVNDEKSAIYLAGINSSTEIQELIDLTGFQLGEFPFRYLGVPLLSSRLNVCHYAPLFDRIRSLILGWSKHTLSFAGRLELIRAVIEGVLCFWMSIFPLPQSVIDRLESMCRNFLWAKRSEGRNKPLIAWKIVCTPKHEGGLGLHNLKVWNLSLLCRSFWDIHSKKDSLWIKWIDHVYLKGASIWELQNEKNSSVFFKKILHIRDCFILKFGGTGSAITAISSACVDDRLSAKIAYDILLDHRDKVRWYAIVWKASIPPKWSFILWLCIHSKLLTLDKLDYLNIGSLCPLCGIANESRNHLFFNCQISKNIWIEIQQWLHFPHNLNGLSSIIRWIIQGRRFSGFLGKRRCITLAATVYCIWQARNLKHFEGAPVVTSIIVEKIKFLVLRSIHLSRLY